MSTWQRQTSHQLVLQVHRLLKSPDKDIKQTCQVCSYFQKQKTVYAGIVINCNPPNIISQSWIFYTSLVSLHYKNPKA